MTALESTFFRLGEAQLCLDCQAVSDNHSACPACASTHLLGLAGILDRDKSEERTPHATEEAHSAD